MDHRARQAPRDGGQSARSQLHAALPGHLDFGGRAVKCCRKRPRVAPPRLCRQWHLRLSRCLQPEPSSQGGGGAKLAVVFTNLAPGRRQLRTLKVPLQVRDLSEMVQFNGVQSFLHAASKRACPKKTPLGWVIGEHENGVASAVGRDLEFGEAKLAPPIA